MNILHRFQYFTLTIDGVHCEKRSKKQVIFFFLSGGRLGCGRTGLVVSLDTHWSPPSVSVSAQLLTRPLADPAQTPLTRPVLSAGFLKVSSEDDYPRFRYDTNDSIKCWLFWVQIKCIKGLLQSITHFTIWVACECPPWRARMPWPPRPPCWSSS